MAEKFLEQIRASRPLIHNITNYVTAGDCANMLLAVGASPIMADAPEEAEEIAAACQGLNLNMGTFSKSHLQAMMVAGRQATAMGKPVVLDPVGIGASAFRRKGVESLLQAIRFTAIRGNLSEISTIAAITTGEKITGDGGRGVDGDQKAIITKDDLEDIIVRIKPLAKSLNTIIMLSGAKDVITDGKAVAIIENGHPLMSKVTGAGCQLGALTAAFFTVSQTLEAAIGATCAMGLCGQLAFANLREDEGSGLYGKRIIDSMYRLTDKELEQGAAYELR